MAFHIDSSGGRIGPFWWINSDLRPMTLLFREGDFANLVGFVQFGTCGFGANPYVVLTPLL